MKILFHDNALNERGTTVSIENYAHLLSSFGWDVSIAYGSHAQNVPAVVERIGKSFDLYPYGEFKELEKIQHQFDVAYFQKSGGRDGKVFRETKSIVHVVFQEYDPHGDSYVYISDWLADQMKQYKLRPRTLMKGYQAKKRDCKNALEFDSLPLLCDVGPIDRVRDGSFGLTEDHFVILRYGGFDTFDVPWVQAELLRFIEEHSNAVALLVNTRPFCQHSRIRFLPPFTTAQERNHFLALSDACLHARIRGESFGMYVVEAMQAGRTLLSWAGGIDQNHVKLLNNTGALFSNPHQLREKLRAASSGEQPVNISALTERSESFKPSNIAPRFQSLLNQLDR
jgi:hypothetical protein